MVVIGQLRETQGPRIFCGKQDRVLRCKRLKKKKKEAIVGPSNQGRGIREAGSRDRQCSAQPAQHGPTHPRGSAAEIGKR